MSLIVYSTPTTPHFSPALKSLLTPSITEPTIVPLNESTKQPALFCVHPITGMSALVFYFLHYQFGSYFTDRLPQGKKSVKSLFRSHIFSLSISGSYLTEGVLFGKGYVVTLNHVSKSHVKVIADLFQIQHWTIIFLPLAHLAQICPLEWQTVKVAVTLKYSSMSMQNFSDRG